MSLEAGTHQIGPGDGRLGVRTYREGVAAKAGHDLIIEVRSWEATVEVGEDGAPVSVELTADARSLDPVEGLRGVKPLSDRDRGEIRRTIDAKVLGGEPVAFRSSAVEAAGGGRLRVRGDLTIRGRGRPVDLELAVGDDGTVSGTVPLVQSDWGIKPYRGLMGALKVRDSVEVDFEGRLPVG
jgi:hypothetical protein